MTLREEIASLICIHENGIGTRELVEAQEGSDHQGEWQSALNTADAIIAMLHDQSMRGILVLPWPASVDTHAERQDPAEGLGPKDG